jgi:hypothetical protein
LVRTKEPETCNWQLETRNQKMEDGKEEKSKKKY